MDTNKDDKIIRIVREGEKKLTEVFARIDETAFENTARVMDAFRGHRVDVSMFYPTTGYGYDDKGRDVLDKIYADVFGAEAGFVRHSIANGTHALSIALYSLLRPGDTLLSITGRPYDTLEKVIGIGGKSADNGSTDGSLADFGVSYSEVPLGGDYEDAIRRAKNLKVVYMQRSKGYSDRPTLSAAAINAIIDRVRALTGAFIVVDNCYGEFVDSEEPRADLVVGSLIKNPGGGMAESGAYIVGTKRAVELASYRLTTVGVGLEVGASLGHTKSMYKGLFYAPHTVAQALKTAALASYVFSKLGCEVSPGWNESRHDIIQTVRCGTPEKLCAFCRGIQYASPVDSYVTPEPWDMPGYSDQVIMAAGAFTQGASIELSADGPMREPYIAFMQGGLTYESGKLAVISAARSYCENDG